MAIPFGLLGLLVVYFLFPFALDVLDKISPLVIYIVSSFLAIILLLDLITSFNVVVKFTSLVGKAPRDVTEEIKRFMKEKISKRKAKN